MPGHWPRRIVALTAETTELVFALGCGDRLVGVSGYAVRPPEARRKPRVAAFSTANVQRIVSLRPDLVLGFSDLQAGIAAELVRAGVTVLITNQRSLEETYTAMAVVAGALGERGRGDALIDGMAGEIAAIAASAGSLSRHPKVYFEEWDDPLISGIRWVGEIIELCGGEDAFARRRGAAASERVVSPEEVVAADPELIVASWCGKKANLGRIAARPGWGSVPAVRNGYVHEVKSADILAPGLSLVRGARQVAAMIRAVVEGVPYAQMPGADAK